MRISVAMATYNGEAYLPAQLESLAAQTVLPAELVVSDDGSSDATLDIIAAFAATALFPVRLLSKPERLGFGDNFLFAAAACRHELVAFCDQDDFWLPHKLETARARLMADDSLLALHRLTTTDGALTPSGLWTQGILQDAVCQPLDVDPYLNGWGNTMLFRRELAHLIAREMRPRQPEKTRPLSHDTWIYTLAAALGRVSHIAEPLILYRLHERNTIGIEPITGWRQKAARWTSSMRRLRERMTFYRHMADLFKALGETTGPYAEPARTAAKRYTELCDPIAARLDIYDGPSMRSRLRAYLSKRRPATATKSRVKDLVLGVAGLHALLE